MTQAGTSCEATVFDESEDERYRCEQPPQHGGLHSQDDGLVLWWDSDPDSICYVAP